MSEKIKANGSKLEVWNGSAKHTSGGLVKDDLVKNKRGKIVSRKQQAAGRKAAERNNIVPKTKEQLALLRQKN